MISSNAPNQQSDEFLAKCSTVPDLMLAINPDSHHEPDNLRLMHPAQPIALSTDRQVIVQRARTAEIMRNDVIGLPSLSHAPATNMTCATRFGPNLLSLASCKAADFPDYAR